MSKTHTSASVSIHYINIIHNALERMGLACGSMQSLIGQFTELEYYLNRVSLDVLNGEWENAVSITQDPIIGLHVGEQIHPNDYGLLGQIMMNSPNIAQALENVISVEFIINNLFVSEIMQDEERVINRIHCHQYEAESIRHIIEQDISALINIGTFIMNKQYDAHTQPIEVHFRHKPAAKITEYERVLKTKVLFQQEYNQAIFPAAVLEAPIYNPNPRIAKMLNEELQQLIHEIENKDTLTLKLWRLFQTHHPKLNCDIEHVAQTFNMTARTFQRHLQQEGTSFQNELTGYRTHHAKTLLNNKTLSISEVAFEMGFNNSSAFHKAFKRWTGYTPKEYQSENHSLSN